MTEKYLAEIISARIKHIFEQIKQDLERRHLLDLPGGIVIIGGGAILPGVEELAQEVFGVNVKLFVPNQIGIRNPAFAHVISLSEYAGNLTDVDIIAQAAQPVVPAYNAEKIESPVDAQEIPVASNDSKKEPKTTFTDRMKNLIGNMFD